MSERKTTWVCVRCNHQLEGNPRWCPHCMHTVFKPIYPDPPKDTQAAPVPADRGKG